VTEKKFNILNFHFGRKKYKISDYIKVSLLLRGTISVMAWLPFVSKKKAFNLIDELQLKGKHDLLNRFIIEDPEFLDYRLERELNKAENKWLKETSGN